MLIGDLNVGRMNEIKRQTITPFKSLQITKIGGMTNTNFNALADKLKALHTSKLDFNTTLILLMR